MRTSPKNHEESLYKSAKACYTALMKKYHEGTVEYEISKGEKKVKPRLLLHACCGPCASSVLEYLTPHFDVTVYYYNPNILPKEEFIKRENALKDVISHFENVKLIVPEQSQDEYISFVKGHKDELEGGARCTLCFNLRLENTAKYMLAHSSEYDFFATTLTVSPHKNAPLINEIGTAVAQKLGVNYLCSDFKKRDGYLRSIRLCQEWGIYRQQYCGCVKEFLD